jgi:ABC-type antimicrobial peptide transport system permease subunit
MTIVGVAGDVRQSSPESPPASELYMPLAQHPYYANEVQVVLRTAVEPGSITGALRKLVRATNPEIAMKFQTMDAMVADSIAKPRLRLFLVGMFAGLALVLAMIGVYGVMSYVVTERTPELGLRVAMGAVPQDILTLVLGRAVQLAGGGLAIGALLSIAFGRLIESMLFGVAARDAETYAAVAVALLCMTLLAAAIPAWRASRVDAVTALRQE